MPELLALFGLGFVNGGSICALSCLHYLGPYLLSEGAGFRQGTQATASYLFGKVLGYSAMGALAAWIGEFVFGISKVYGALILGLALLGLAVAIWLKKPACPKKTSRLWSLGLMSSFIPCPALSVMLLAAGATQSWMMGLGYGMAYGLGLLVSPMLLAGGSVGFLGKRFVEEMASLTPWIKGASCLVIVLLAGKLLLWETSWSF